MPLPAAFPKKETTINGPRTRRWMLTAGECREFLAHRIARMGIDVAQSPYNLVRLRPEGSFILACLDGEGRMFLEGRWQRVAAGELCLAPPRVLNALHSALCHHYISLVQRLAQRAATPWRTTSRVNDIWEFVASHLADEWTLPMLANRCHLSPEHLRQLCQREFGRTPMDHMAYMRMLRAKELLETTNDKVEVIASAVGYRIGTVFSRAFVRFVGVLPTHYRQQR